jgi:hypothetical protein
MTLEILSEVDALKPLLEKAKKNKGKVVEIVSFAQDTVSGCKRLYSNLGVRDERKLNQALTSFIQILVHDGESRETLESAFENEPDQVRQYSHHNEMVSEWPTVQDNLIIGIRAIRDQRGESVRTWYLKSLK